MTEEIKAAVQYKSLLPSSEFMTANPLLEAAFPLILLFLQLKSIETEIDINRLRRNIMTEINIFVNQAKAAQCSDQLTLAARYCLCTALDESISLTPWGSKSGWSQQSLLSLIHRETWGGERFFIILEKMAVEPKKNLPLLELLYLLLALGFEGKYYDQDSTMRENLQHRLYQLIIAFHPEAVKNLSPSLDIIKNCHIEKATKNYYLRFFWGILAGILGIGLMFNTLLYWKASPFLQDLKDINRAQSAFSFPIGSPEVFHQFKNKTKPYLHVKHHHHYDNKYKMNQDNIILPPPDSIKQS